jgi:hypothetical protein
MPLKIVYQNPHRPGEAGVKIVPDEQQDEAEKKLLEARGFVVTEMTILPPEWTLGRPRSGHHRRC